MAIKDLSEITCHLFLCNGGICKKKPEVGLLVSADQAGYIFFWVKIGQDYKLLTEDKISENITTLQWNQNGSMLAVGTDQGKVVIYNY